jgi:hypothetical protein
MNKKRRETAAPTSGPEAEVRAINAEPWEPLPGMVKRQCPMCRYFFAAPTSSNELRCPECLSRFAPRAAMARI